MLQCGSIWTVLALQWLTADFGGNFCVVLYKGFGKEEMLTKPLIPCGALTVPTTIAPLCHSGSFLMSPRHFAVLWVRKSPLQQRILRKRLVISLCLMNSVGRLAHSQSAGAAGSMPLAGAELSATPARDHGISLTSSSSVREFLREIFTARPNRDLVRFSASQSDHACNTAVCCNLKNALKRNRSERTRNAPMQCVHCIVKNREGIIHIPSEKKVFRNAAGTCLKNANATHRWQNSA